jgi:hypothetical protein
VASGGRGAALDQDDLVLDQQAAPGRRYASPRLAGPLFVLAFIFEGLFNRLVPPLTLGFLPHMVLTSLFLGAMVFYWIVLRDRPRAPRLARLRIATVYLIAWGFVSCLAQDKVIENLVFWGMWSAGIFMGWWAIPCLFRGLDLDRRVQLLSVVLAACVLLASVGLYSPSGRLSGMIRGATSAGRLMALALILGVARWVSGRKTPFWLPYCTVLAGLLLVMTRTRASMAAGIFGSGFVVWNAAFSRRGGGRLSQQRALSILFILPVVLMIVLMSSWFSEEDAIEYFRLEGGIEGVYQARSMNWEHSWAELPTYGILGKGYLSKFGDSHKTVNIMGLSFPKYQWTTGADPLNMLLLASKQIGIVGGLLLAGMLVCLAGAARRLHGMARAIAGGWLAAGLVFGLLDGNWLVSFGDPMDRLSMVALAAMLSVPADNARDKPDTLRASND